MGHNLSRVGIVMWTANWYVFENPGASRLEIERHVQSKLGSHSATKLVTGSRWQHLWTRERVPSEHRKGTRWGYSVTPLGRKLLEMPMPPSLEEVSKASNLRLEKRRHGADWYTDAQEREMLTPRARVSSFLYAQREGVPTQIDDGMGGVKYNPNATARVRSDEVLIFLGPCQMRVCPQYYCSDRLVNMGTIRVLSAGGEILIVDPEHVRPLVNRRYRIPQEAT